MKKSNQNFVIDSLAIIAFVFLTTTGVLMRYILPPGSGKHSTIWGLDRHDWGAVHFWISIAFFSILALHLIYHWRWIVKVASGKPRHYSKNRVILGIIGVVTVILLSVSPLLSPIKKEGKSEEHTTESSHESETVSIKGSMTLMDVEKATGVPASFIISSLKLPKSISVDEKLSSLKDTYGLEMSEVRDLLTHYEGN